MKLKSDAHPPYKWLAERLEEGYVLHSASGVVINRILDVHPAIVLVVRYDPEAALSLVNICNE